MDLFYLSVCVSGGCGDDGLADFVHTHRKIPLNANQLITVGQCKESQNTRNAEMDSIIRLGHIKEGSVMVLQLKNKQNSSGDNRQ